METGAVIVADHENLTLAQSFRFITKGMLKGESRGTMPLAIARLCAKRAMHASTVKSHL